MNEGLSEPLARVPITHPAGHIDTATLAGWADVQRTLCAWAAKGCAVVARGDVVLDVATLATASAQDLGGAELLIFHTHVVTQYPWLVQPAGREGH